MNAGCANISIPGGSLLPLLLFVEEKTPPPTLPPQETSPFLFSQDEEFFLSSQPTVTLPLYGIETIKASRIVSSSSFQLDVFPRPLG